MVWSLFCIIFFDELDKISNTEHGKEITGILTHLTDVSQNDTFCDKYFSGIDIDLSKQILAAVEKAKNSPLPDINELTTNVYEKGSY